MYVPHYDAILHAIGTNRDEIKERSEISIPVTLLRFLLQMAVAQGEFNSAGYLAQNKDIREAAKSGRIPDPRRHYIDFGFFEGRRGATPAVDESWYRRTYSDIAPAIRTATIASGSEHFDAIGAEEFRAPSAVYVTDANEWRRVCSKS